MKNKEIMIYYKDTRVHAYWSSTLPTKIGIASRIHDLAKWKDTGGYYKKMGDYIVDIDSKASWLVRVHPSWMKLYKIIDASKRSKS